MSRTVLGVILVVALAAVLGAIAWSFVDAFDPVAAGVRGTLQSRSAAAGNGFNLVIVDGPPAGAAAAVDAIELGLLFGGIPMALTAMVLARRRGSPRTWTGGWSQVFLAGFVVQLASLCFTSLVFVGFIFLIALDDPGSRRLDEVAGASALLLSMACSAAALWWWRSLRSSVDTVLPRVIPAR